MIRALRSRFLKALPVHLLPMILLFAVGLSLPAKAHPNIRLDYRLLFNFKGANVTAIGETWTFDPQFSQELLSTFDVDRDGTFSAAETKAMGHKILKNLSESRYFTFVSVDGHDLGKLPPIGFKAQARHGTVTVAFGSRLPAAVNAAKSHLSVLIKDPGFVVLTRLAKQRPVVLRGAPKGHCRSQVVDDPQDAYFGGLVVPKEVSLTCK